MPSASAPSRMPSSATLLVLLCSALPPAPVLGSRTPTAGAGAAAPAVTATGFCAVTATGFCAVTATGFCPVTFCDITGDGVGGTGVGGLGDAVGGGGGGGGGTVVAATAGVGV